MNIKNEEFEAIKSALLTTYFEARDCGTYFIMERMDNILSYMQQIENREIKKRQSLK